MGLTYFKRYRMELDLEVPPELQVSPLPTGYQLVPWEEGLVREHAAAKYASFHLEMDAHVFPCLGHRDGCLRLMREISRRASFVPEATWLIRHWPEDGYGPVPVGTVQGIASEGWGALQNLGVARGYRGRGLGSILLSRAMAGFRAAGLQQMHLEVTSANTAAVRLYQRLGFRNARTLFKATEVVGV